jgi:hypothetical protein
MIENKVYPTILYNKKKLTMFKGKHCECIMCKRGKCSGDPTHLFYAQGMEHFLCWKCAEVYSEFGIKVWEMIF